MNIRPATYTIRTNIERDNFLKVAQSFGVNVLRPPANRNLPDVAMVDQRSGRFRAFAHFWRSAKSSRQERRILVE